MEQPPRPRPMGFPTGRGPAAVRRRIEAMEHVLNQLRKRTAPAPPVTLELAA